MLLDPNPVLPPPTSIQWARTARKLTSLPSQKNGVYTAMLFKMLAADLRMVDQKDIAGVNVVLAVDFDAVLHRDAKIGEKDRQRAFVLRHRPPLMIEHRDAVILHLVDHHVVGGLLQNRRHLVGGGLQSAADNFYGNGIDGT